VAQIAARLRAMRILLLFCLMLQFSPRVNSGDEKGYGSVLISEENMNLRGISADYPSVSETGPRQKAATAKESKASVRRLNDAGAIVIWASGTNGKILRSADSGKTWKELHVEGGDTLDFRGIQSFGSQTAYAMSVGTEGKSRIYKTIDAGETWRLQYSDKRPGFFLDGLICRNQNECFAVSDPLDGKFLLLHTEDGVRWQELPRESMPAALPNEGAFAASNSSLAFCGDRELILGTGGPAARVFRSRDAGRSWNVVETPILSGSASSGIFSLRCSGDTVVAVGGDYREVTGSLRVAAYSPDHGATWKLAEQGPPGFRSGVETIDGGTWVAVGPTGEDLSVDHGMHWKPSGSAALNAVFVLRGGMALGAGPEGVVELLRDWKPKN
jgi:photosystem II stability/assembly factor-like uncharacterized protein